MSAQCEFCKEAPATQDHGPYRVCDDCHYEALCDEQADVEFQRMAYGGTVSELRQELFDYPDEPRWDA